MRARRSPPPRSPTKVLVELAKEKDVNIRGYVGAHPLTSLELLESLAKGRSHTVRAGEADHTAPTSIIKGFAADKVEYIRQIAKKNLTGKKKNRSDQHTVFPSALYLVTEKEVLR